MNAAQNAAAQAGRHMQDAVRQPLESRLFAAFLQQRDRLRRLAAGMGLAGADIDDVLQDVSMEVLRHSDRFEQEGRMTPWLIRTTANRCKLEHRRRFRRRVSDIAQRRPELGQAVAADTGDVARRAAAAEELEIVRQTMAKLAPSPLAILVLRYFCDLDSTEIGEALGLNASTVRSRLREARMILAEKLMRRGVKP